MKFFATALVFAAFSATEAMGQALGQSCVNGTLVKVFNRINAMRATNTGSADSIRFAAAQSAWNAAAKWSMTQNSSNAAVYNVNVLSAGRITASNTIIQAMTAGFTPMTWSEGMAAGNNAYTTEWAAAFGTANAFTSLTSSNGTTSASRAQANGTVTGSLVESAYFFSAYSIDATDMLNFIIVNDGSTNPMRDAVFANANKTKYTKFSGGIAARSGCTVSSSTPTACDHVMIVTVAQGFTNGSGVASCQPTINYGGGICDPDTWAKSVFEEMQESRLAGLSTYKPILDSMASNCSGLSCTFDWNGNGATSTETFSGGAAKITTAGQACGLNNLSQYTWVPGMFMAAKDGTALLTSASSISSTQGASTLGSRGLVYGTPGNQFADGIYKGDNTARNTVAALLIDDADDALSFRNAARLSGNNQAGVACGVHTDNQKICTVIVGAGYTTSASYATCTAPVVAASAPVESGAAALATAGIAAATMAFLF